MQELATTYLEIEADNKGVNHCILSVQQTGRERLMTQEEMILFQDIHRKFKNRKVVQV